MKASLLIFLSIISIQACSSPETRRESVDSIEIVESIDVPTDTTPSLFKGLYTFGNEVNTFQACDPEGKVYWVNDSLTSLRGPYEKTNRFPSYPYESIYAEVRGYLAGKSKLGYASEYENVLVVTDIVKVEAKNFRTECFNYEFIVLGNEPFWSLEIIPAEKRIVFKNVGLEKVTEFIYAPAKVESNVYKYETTSPSNEKLVAIIRKEKCSDGMSDRQYNYSAEITINGQVFKGCAIKKGDLFPDQP